MHRDDLSVRQLATRFGIERTQVQRWLRGLTISAPYRAKLADMFGVSPDEFKPPDRLAKIRPLLEQAEELRRQEGLRPGTLQNELRRLARD